MNTHFKVFVYLNIPQYMCDFYICNCLKMVKQSQINEYSDINGIIKLCGALVSTVTRFHSQYIKEHLEEK